MRKATPALRSAPYTQTAIRIPADILPRCERLAPKIARDPTAAAAAGRVTRQYVIRLALIRGLEVLEREYNAK